MSFLDTITHSSRGSLSLEINDSIATLWLDNPKAKNAFSIRMMKQLKHVVLELEHSNVHVLFVRGKGNTFCSGGDLKDVRNSLLAEGSDMHHWMNNWLERLRKSVPLSVAVVEGYAIGGGAELLTACDIVIAREDSQIGFVQGQLGVTPGWGGHSRLRNKIGLAKSRLLLMSCSRYSAEQAHMLGLVDLVTDDLDGLLSKITSGLSVNLVLDQIVELGNDETNEHDIFSILWAGSAHRFALGL